MDASVGSRRVIEGASVMQSPLVSRVFQTLFQKSRWETVSRVREGCLRDSALLLYLRAALVRAYSALLAAVHHEQPR
jgi:hypothetical protein